VNTTIAGNVRGYRPDFLIERIDRAKEPLRFPLHWKELHEVKGGQFIKNPNTIRKHEAAMNWCRKRGMRFVVIKVNGRRDLPNVDERDGDARPQRHRRGRAQPPAQ